MKENISFQLTKTEITELKYFNILKVLLNTQIVWMTFIKTLKHETQIKNVKY